MCKKSQHISIRNKQKTKEERKTKMEIMKEWKERKGERKNSGTQEIKNRVTNNKQ